MSAVIVEAPPESKIGFQCYGGARDAWRYRGEFILAGPYETGKTRALLEKLNVLHAKYPGSRGLMVRKTYTSLINSAVVTYEQKVLPYPPGHPRCTVEKFGKSKPEWYDYPNGARLVLGGMDNPDKFLSAEFDWIYVNQAEELTLDDWEKLTGRATGRAGNAPYSQVMGDCNPGGPHHWILGRRDRGALRLFKSRHEDNPTLFDPVTGQITERGKKTLADLDNLTGVRYKRGRLGLWAGAEGMVYEDWDDAIHLIPRFEIPGTWRRFRVIDFGFRNPFVCAWWAADEDDRLYRYREIYMTGRTVREHAEHINAYSAGERYVATIADHDASDRATLAENGISTIAANKDVLLGIEKVQQRLKVQADGRPRLFYLRDSLVEVDTSLQERFKPICTEQEFPGYVYPDRREGKTDDEHPVKVDDHGMDMTRYMVAHLDLSDGPVVRRVAAVGMYPTQERLNAPRRGGRSRRSTGKARPD